MEYQGSEFDAMMEEIIRLFESNEERREKEEEKCENEKILAEDTRLKTLETIVKRGKGKANKRTMVICLVFYKTKGNLVIYLKEKHRNDLAIQK